VRTVLERPGQHIPLRLVGPSDKYLASKEELFALCRVDQDDAFWQHSPALRTLAEDGFPLQAGHGDDAFLVPDVEHLKYWFVSQERRRPLFFAAFPPLSRHFPRHAGLVRPLCASDAQQSTPLSCQRRCHVSVRPCPCHARVMSMPRQALSNPGPVMPCNSASPEASPCFLPFPRPSRPFSHFLCLGMHVST
jgi:hypothetical protein